MSKFDISVNTVSSSTDRSIHKHLVLKNQNRKKGRKNVLLVAKVQRVCLQNTNGTSMSYSLPLELRVHHEEGTPDPVFTVVSFT